MEADDTTTPEPEPEPKDALKFGDTESEEEGPERLPGIVGLVGSAGLTLGPLPPTEKP